MSTSQDPHTTSASPPSWPVKNREQARDEWLGALATLFAQAVTWSEEQGWWTGADEKDVVDDRLGAYPAPVLRLQSPKSRLILEPIARYVVGADGRVDMCVFPSWDHLAIVRTAEGWRIRGNGEPPIDLAWSKEGFLAAADYLASKA